MSVFVLKIIALASMIIDHTGYFMGSHSLINWDTYTLLRSIGRVAFPIYCFLLVNGFDKTSDRQRYLARLMLFAVLSQVPFTLAFSFANEANASAGLNFSLGFAPLPYLLFIICTLAAYLFLARRDLSALWLALFLVLGAVRLQINAYQILGSNLNVFYTLSFGLAAMAVLDDLIYQELPLPKALLRGIFLVCAILVLQPHADYAYKGLLLILMLYACRSRRLLQVVAMGLWCGLEYWSGNPMYFYFSLISMLPVLFYNGKKGPGLKIGFYALYPLHLLVLGIVGMFL